MTTRRRRITAAVLLVSYVLASAGAWLHTAQRYLQGADAAGVAMVPGAVDCGCGHHSSYLGRVTKTREISDAARRMSQPVPHPRHHHDDCTVCRFQLTKKLVEFVPLAATLSGDCPEPVVLGAPLARVAPQLATSESRAPPLCA